MASTDRTRPTEDDEGKNVIDSTGERIGIVSSVEGGTIHVETDPGLTDSIKATLGWGDTEGTQTIDASHVAEISDDAVHLASEDPGATDVDVGETSATGAEAPTDETGTGTGHEDESTDRNDLPPEDRRDDPVDGDLSGDETAAEMDDVGDVTDEGVSETADAGADEMGIPTGEDDRKTEDRPPGAADDGGLSTDANERPPGAEDRGHGDVQDEQTNDPRGGDDVQDPVPEEPRDAEDVHENAEELNPESDADPEDQPSTGEAATRGAEEDADLGRDDDSDERSS